MASISGMSARLKVLRASLCPRPKPQMWMPQGVCVREEEDGVLYYVNEEAKAIDERCEKLGITPNVYLVDDDFNPDMDGCEQEGDDDGEQHSIAP